MQRITKHILSSWPFWLGLSAGIIFILLPVTGYQLTHFPGDLGDARFNVYLLEHAHKYLTFQIDSFWDAPFMYPQEKIITYSDNFLGTAPFFSVFRLLGFDRLTSFQLWFILMGILSYSCCYFFLKDLFKNRYAAVLGSMVFAFSIALHSQLTHAQTFTRFPVPLAFWMCLLFYRGLKPGYFFLAVLFVVYQLYCGLYLGLMLLLPVSIIMLLIVIMRWKTIKNKLQDAYWLRTMTWSVVINIFLLFPMIMPYIQRALETGYYNYDYVAHSVPTIKSFFYSKPGSLIWGLLDTTGEKITNSYDHQLFPGAVAMICLLVWGLYIINKLIRKKGFTTFPEKMILLLFLTACITFMFFVRIKTGSLFYFLYHIPGFGSLRSLVRIINIELLFFAIAVGFVFHYLLLKIPKRSIIVFISFAGILIIDNYVKADYAYRTEKKIAQKRVEPIMKKMKTISRDALASYEPAKIDNSIWCQLDAMLAAQSLNLKVVNGYSSTSAPGFGDFWFTMDVPSRKRYFEAQNFSPDTLVVIK